MIPQNRSIRSDSVQSGPILSGVRPLDIEVVLFCLFNSFLMTYRYMSDYHNQSTEFSSFFQFGSQSSLTFYASSRSHQL